VTAQSSPRFSLRRGFGSCAAPWSGAQRSTVAGPARLAEVASLPRQRLQLPRQEVLWHGQGRCVFWRGERAVLAWQSCVLCPSFPFQGDDVCEEGRAAAPDRAREVLD